MNSQILNKYGLKFYKTSNGRVGAKSSSHISLAAIFNIPGYEIIEIIQEFIDLMDLALTGNYNQIDWDDTDIGGNIGSALYWVIINDDMTVSLAFNDFPYETYPLVDVKEIFTSWLEFLKM